MELDVTGGRLEAAWWGPGPAEAPTLVLLHEGLGCVDLWRDVPECLAAATGWGVFAYSRFGYGRSTPITLPRPLSYMHHEAQVVLPEVLYAAGIRRCVPIGHSDGGSIAAIYAGSVGSAGARAPAPSSWPGVCRPSALRRRGVDGRDMPHAYQDKPGLEKELAAQAVALPSWPGSPGPSIAARGGGVGPDVPGQDGEGKILLQPPSYPDSYGDTHGHDDEATTMHRPSSHPDSHGATCPDDHEATPHPDDPSILALITIAAHFFVEDVSVASIAQIRTEYQAGLLRAKLARYHNDVDRAFYGWNGAWLDPDFRRFNITAFLPHIKVPILGLQGADDAYGTDEQLHVLKAKVRAPITTALIPGAKHSPHLEARDATLAAITGFIADILRDSSP